MNKNNRKCPVSIQIEDDAPFIPEYVGIIGVQYGKNETTQPGDRVRGYKPTSKVAVLEYTFQGLEYYDYYRDGRWTKKDDGTSLFVAKGLLSK